ncbi:hypothetical protein, partial [Salmonella sp. s54395]|uniref:hypothetical protein n=1 Tax=Salmonella sp. s54395 TaxID=3159664 RepID=UPI00398158F9
MQLRWQRLQGRYRQRQQPRQQPQRWQRLEQPLEQRQVRWSLQRTRWDQPSQPPLGVWFLVQPHLPPIDLHMGR